MAKESEAVGTGCLTDVIPGALGATELSEVGDRVPGCFGGCDGGDGRKETVVAKENIGEVVGG